MKETMKGYKVFNPDWTCKGFQFEVGKVFEEDVTPVCCDRGFHFCTKISDCFSYYSFNPNNKVAEVEALGDIDTKDDNSKCCTNKIHIIREIIWQEVLDLVNLGKGCTGICNSGNYNSGYYNSGNYNSGNCNTGDYNSGNFNSGSCNSGDCNSGSHNSGNYNSGRWNSGYRNSGNHNSGDYNSGDYNSGNCNTGDYNMGDYNSGDYNIGDYNSGNHNIGSYNIGDWNKACFSYGCFNTESNKIFLFNKPSDWTYQDWLDSDTANFLMECPSNITSWVPKEYMTDEEKEQHPEYSVTGGFLKKDKKEKERQMWWNGLSDKQKDSIMQLPNFDKDIFKEITGINID